MFFYDWTLILLIPALILTIFAQAKVSSSFRKYKKVMSSKGYTGAEVARQILLNNGLNNVQVERIPGELSDHYDPRSKVLRLSNDVYDSQSVAAIGVAAHEAGHALQDAESYAPLKIRNAIVPVTQFSSSASWILIIIGLILSAPKLAAAGVILFSAVVIFQLVTLPVEFNASNRALAIVSAGNFLDNQELKGAKKVLSAAALTYVAAALTAILQLLRLVLIVFSNRD